MPEDSAVKNMTTLLRERQTAHPVLVRMDEALHRVDQLALALEKAAAEIERQLGIVKGKL